MSIRLMSQVWTLDLNHAEQIVLLVMADHANDDGKNAYPSVPSVAWKAGYSIRQTQRILSQLRDHGLLIPVGPPPVRGRTQEYIVQLEGFRTKPPLLAVEAGAAERLNNLLDDVVKKAEERGDKMAPLEKKGVTPEDVKGDISNEMGDITMSDHPPVDPSKEPSNYLCQSCTIGIGEFNHYHIEGKDGYFCEECFNRLSPIIPDNEEIQCLGPVVQIPRSTPDPRVSEIRNQLVEIRGYKSSVAAAEAASIKRMLRDYTPEQIIQGYKVLKEEVFWQDKFLGMMSVEKQLGELVKNNFRTGPRQANTQFDNERKGWSFE